MAPTISFLCYPGKIPDDVCTALSQCHGKHRCSSHPVRCNSWPAKLRVHYKHLEAHVQEKHKPLPQIGCPGSVEFVERSVERELKRVHMIHAKECIWPVEIAVCHCQLS